MKYYRFKAQFWATVSLVAMCLTFLFMVFSETQHALYAAMTAVVAVFLYLLYAEGTDPKIYAGPL